MHYIKYKEIKHHGTPNFPAGYYHVTENHPQYAMPYHWHEELELIHIVSGIFEVTINEITRVAGPGDVLFVNSGFLHGGTPHDCVYECLVFPVGLLFNQTYASTFLKQLDGQDFILEEYYPGESGPEEETPDPGRNDPACESSSAASRIPALVAGLFSTLRETGEGGELQCIGLLYQIMGILCSEKRYTVSDKSDLSAHRNIYLLKNVLNYIESHYPEKIELNALARTAGMSPKYFCHFFSEMTGRTPIDYVNYYRIERACFQLANTDVSITEAALLCGFNDVSYFIRTFKKYKGRSPRQYLKVPSI